MAVTPGNVALSGWDEAPSGASLDTASFTVSAGQMLVVFGAWASNDLSVSSVVWDPASNNEALTVRADFYGNFGNIFIATIDAPSAGTGVARVTLSGTPDDNFWIGAVPLSADGTLSFNAVSTAAQAAGTTVNSDGTGICIDVFMETFTTAANYDSSDQTLFSDGNSPIANTFYSGDSFYTTFASYKSPGASTTNMNATGTNTPHHVCIHIAEASVSAYDLTAESGSFSLSGTAAELDAARLLSAASASFALSGAAASLLTGAVLSAESTFYSLSGQIAALMRAALLEPVTDRYAFAGTDVALEYGGNAEMAADAGAYSLAGTDASLLSGPYMLAEMGAIVQGANDVSFVLGLGLVAESAAFTLTGAAAAMLRGVVMAGGAGSYGVVGTDAALTFAGLTDFVMPADTVAFAISGAEVSLLRTYLLAAASAAYAISGTDADLFQSIGLPADSATFVLTGTDVALLRRLILRSAAGSYSLTGADVAFPYSGDVVIGRVPNIVSTTTRRSITN